MSEDVLLEFVNQMDLELVVCSQKDAWRFSGLRFRV